MGCLTALQNHLLLFVSIILCILAGARGEDMGGQGAPSPIWSSRAPATVRRRIARQLEEKIVATLRRTTIPRREVSADMTLGQENA